MDEDMRVVAKAAAFLLLIMSFGCSSLVITSTATGNVIYSAAENTPDMTAVGGSMSDSPEPVITVVDESVVPGAGESTLFTLNLDSGTSDMLFSTIMLDQIADNLENRDVRITVELLDVMEHSGSNELIVSFAFSGETYWTSVSNFLQMAGIELLE